ncbi:MAG: hypothetical protein KTR32_24855 [Granulosicoccus sp.]|nr:hypothetical protein [Granulosicoccus sp.]
MRILTFQSHHRRRFAIARAWLTVALIAMPIYSSAAADVLADLPEAHQELAQRFCLPTQYHQGSDAYRSCLRVQISARESYPPPALTTLAMEEQYAIQSTCKSAGRIGSDDYRSCTNEQLALLAAEPVPQWQTADIDEQHVIQKSCSDVQSPQSGQAYRRCINEALEILGALPKADLSALSFTDRNILKSACLGRTNDARDYRQCLLGMINGDTAGNTGGNATGDTGAGETAAGEEESEQVARAADTRETGARAEPESNMFESSNRSDADNTSRQPASLDSVNNSLPEPTIPTAAAAETRAEQLPKQEIKLSAAADSESTGAATISAPPVPSLPAIPQPALPTQTDQNKEPAQTLSNNPPQEAAGGGDQNLAVTNSVAGDVLQRLQATISGLTGINRMLTVAALAIPLILICTWLILRRSSEHSVAYDAYGEQPLDMLHDDEFEDPQDDRDSNEWLREQASGLFDDELDSSHSATADSGRTTASKHYESSNDVRTDRASSQQAATDGGQQADDQFDELFDSVAVDTNSMNLGATATNTHVGELGQWLSGQSDESKKLSFAIEFLVYWIAYADDRYERSLKARVFKMHNPDEHTQIKRWVLQGDIHSFSDAVRWVQTHASAKQRTQIIDLLIALLVSEKALTPIQNTLFRFLGDAFGLGQIKLDTRFRRAFDYSLPQLPRVDKPVWWQSQSEEQRFRWNSRAVAKQPVDIQHRVKLGLPLTGDLEPAEIAASYQRSATRCNPKNFEELGHREITMVERQLAKFAVARDALLESVT